MPVALHFSTTIYKDLSAIALGAVKFECETALFLENFFGRLIVQSFAWSIVE